MKNIYTYTPSIYDTLMVQSERLARIECFLSFLHITIIRLSIVQCYLLELPGVVPSSRQHCLRPRFTNFKWKRLKKQHNHGNRFSFNVNNRLFIASQQLILYLNSMLTVYIELMPANTAATVIQLYTIIINVTPSSAYYSAQTCSKKLSIIIESH